MELDSVVCFYTIRDDSLESDYPFEVTFTLELPDIDITDLNSESFDIEYVHMAEPPLSSFWICLTIDGEEYILCRGYSSRFNHYPPRNKELIESIYHKYYETFIDTFIKITVSPTVERRSGCTG